MQFKTETDRRIYKWYYEPGEQVRSIGFYVNPYKQYSQAKFRHIFAFDGNYNLYVGQYSIYANHIDSIFDLKDKREYGFIYPQGCSISPEGEAASLCRDYSIVEFEFLETKNIVYLNKRLRPIAQRLYDYGLPPDTLISCKSVDFWWLDIKALLKGNYLERPDSSYFNESKPK